MAVADLVVTMGPRNRRRLTNSTVTLAAIVVVGLAGWWFLGRSPGSPGPLASSSASRSSHAVPSVHVPHMLAFGTSRAGVRRLLGAPTTTQGSCWLYSSKPIAFIQIPPPGETQASEGVSRLKVCFLDNQTSELYYWFVGPRVPKGIWARPLIIDSNP